MAKLHGNWNFADLAEATGTVGPQPGDLLTTDDGYALHVAPNGTRFFHGPRRDFNTYAAGTNILVGSVDVPNAGIYMADIYVAVFDETTGADGKFSQFRVLGYRPGAGSPLTDIDPPALVLDKNLGNGSAWSLQVLTQNSRWGVFLTHSNLNPLKVGVTYRASGSRWDGQ